MKCKNCGSTKAKVEADVDIENLDEESTFTEDGELYIDSHADLCCAVGIAYERLICRDCGKEIEGVGEC